MLYCLLMFFLLTFLLSIEPAQTKAVALGAIEQLLKVLRSEDIDENEVSVTIAARVTAFLCELGNDFIQLST